MGREMVTGACCINLGRSYKGQNNPPREASTNATARPTGVACSRVRTKAATIAVATRRWRRVSGRA
jgi:hypothetical protein